jgi:hypothetical protein
MGDDDYVLEGTTITIPFLRGGDADFIANTPTDVEYLLKFIEMLHTATEQGHDVCEGCEQEIDPFTCHCGIWIKHHSWDDGHTAVPMGCSCYRARE